MWYIYTLKYYYTAIKKNEIMKFIHKCKQAFTVR